MINTNASFIEAEAGQEINYSYETFFMLFLCLYMCVLFLDIC